MDVRPPYPMMLPEIWTAHRVLGIEKEMAVAEQQLASTQLDPPLFSRSSQWKGADSEAESGFNELLRHAKNTRSGWLDQEMRSFRGNTVETPIDDERDSIPILDHGMGGD